MRYILRIVVVFYLVLLGARSTFASYGTLIDWILWCQEIFLDLIVISLASSIAGIRLFKLFGLAPTNSTRELRKVFCLVSGSFLATLVSTVNFRILSKGFGVSLSKTMG